MLDKQNSRELYDDIARYLDEHYVEQVAYYAPMAAAPRDAAPRVTAAPRDVAVPSYSQGALPSKPDEARGRGPLSRIGDFVDALRERKKDEEAKGSKPSDTGSLPPVVVEK